MPAYDNTNFISLVKQLVESGKQTAQMIKSVKFLKDAKEASRKYQVLFNNLEQFREIAQTINALSM